MNIADLDAYELVQEKQLEDIRSKGYILRHKKSGARISVISNEDENKVFYIGFRTPAEDSTGVPHIIEHTVLCGSKEFPVKDPFVELVKGSLNTFLNAMTYPDKTVYPVASCNEKDFQNLMHVYLDAVFHPNIYKYQEIFKQEGWHYELESEDAPLILNGVVYNEMKGAYSSPESVLERVVMNSLFPDTTYGNESGGDPENIPDLTYEDYLDFHRRYYHPCNSYIYLYGDMDVAEKLDWMDKYYLSQYEKIELDSSIKEQVLEQPVEVLRKYPISSSEETKDNTYLSYNVVAGSTLSKELYLAFDVLDYALLNAPGAPLKKALLDAGIGKDIMGGYDSSIMQPIFSITAKNTNPEQKERFIQVIEDTLQRQASGELNHKALLAGLNSSEFRFREADFGSYPKGLIYGLQCLDSWLYDDSMPFIHLEALDTFQSLRDKISQGYFENLIRSYLLDNTHKSIVVIEPEKGLNEKKEQELADKLQAYKDSLSKEEIRQLVADTAHLKEYQQEPSSKEDLEKLPMLTRADMKKEAAPFYNEEKEIDGVKTVHHELFSNGIAYISLLFDVSHVREEQVPDLAILKAVLGYMDTADYSYEDLSNEINLHTGGISSSAVMYSEVAKPGKRHPKFEIRLKALYRELPMAFQLVKSILCSTSLEDEKRLYEILAQAKSRLEMQISSAGHGLSAIRALSYQSETAKFNDLTSGIALYQRVADIEKNFEEKKAQLKQSLSELMITTFRKSNLLLSITCDKEGYEAFLPQASELQNSLFAGEAMPEAMKLTCEKRNEGFKNASQVQFVSRTGDFARHGYEYTGILNILKVILNYDYLWLNIRVKGGAYGCMSGFDRRGDTYFSTYRDPNLRKSNEIFEGIPKYLHDFQADERDMTKYIIGTISNLDTPLNPSAKGSRSMSAYLCGLTYGQIQKERDEILSAQAEDIRRLEELVAAVLSDEQLCVIGNENNLEKDSDLFMNLVSIF